MFADLSENGSMVENLPPFFFQKKISHVWDVKYIVLAWCIKFFTTKDVISSWRLFTELLERCRIPLSTNLWIQRVWCVM